AGQWVQAMVIGMVEEKLVISIGLRSPGKVVFCRIIVPSGFEHVERRRFPVTAVRLQIRIVSLVQERAGSALDVRSEQRCFLVGAFEFTFSFGTKKAPLVEKAQCGDDMRIAGALRQISGKRDSIVMPFSFVPAGGERYGRRGFPHFLSWFRHSCRFYSIMSARFLMRNVRSEKKVARRSVKCRPPSDDPRRNSPELKPYNRLERLSGRALEQ